MPYLVVANGHDMLERVWEEPAKGFSHKQLSVHVIDLVEVLGFICMGGLVQGCLQEWSWQIGVSRQALHLLGDGGALVLQDCHSTQECQGAEIVPGRACACAEAMSIKVLIPSIAAV